MKTTILIHNAETIRAEAFNDDFTGIPIRLYPNRTGVFFKEDIEFINEFTNDDFAVNSKCIPSFLKQFKNLFNIEKCVCISTKDQYGIYKYIICHNVTKDFILEAIYFNTTPTPTPEVITIGLTPLKTN